MSSYLTKTPSKKKDKHKAATTAENMARGKEAEQSGANMASTTFKSSSKSAFGRRSGTR